MMDDGDDFDQDDYELQASELRPLGRVEAKDLLRGCLSALMLRSMLLNSPAEIAREFGGMKEDEARISLACSELAELPSWDAQALLDAATVAADEEQRLMWGQLSREHLARRIGLALKCEGAGEFLTPAEGVFLLRKLNIHVFHELVDAVALMALDGPEPERTYRRLMGRPDSSGADSPPAPASQVTQAAPAISEPVLGSGAMRAAFGHLPGVPKQGFSDVPKWLRKPHILVARREAPSENEWNPVAFAKMMMDDKGITYQTLNSLFLYQEALKPFLRAWQEMNRDANAFGS